MPETPPPHSLELERAAISRIITFEDTHLALILQPGDFYDKALRTVLEACQLAYNKHGELNFLTVCEELKTSKDIARLGGSAFVAEILAESRPYNTAEYLLKRLRHYRAARAGLTVSDDIKKHLIKGNPMTNPEVVADLPLLLTEKSQLIAELLPSSAEVERAQLIADIEQNPHKIESGFEKFDQYTHGGLTEGSLIVIGGRPGVGKTTLACNLAANLIHRDKTFLFISLEMTTREVFLRVLPALYQEETAAIVKNARDIIERMKRVPTIEDRLFSLGAIQSMILQSTADVIFVDYFQLVSIEGKEPRITQLERASRAFKLAAKETGKPIILLSQLSRESEKQKREPVMSDLRGSGSLEQDADIVTFVHDPNQTEEEKKTQDIADDLEGKKGREIKWIIRKNRHGPIGYIDLWFTPRSYTMQEVD